MKRFENINDLQLEYIDEWITSVGNQSETQAHKGLEKKLKFNIRIIRGIMRTANKAHVKVHIHIIPEDHLAVESGLEGEFELGFMFGVKSLEEYMSFKDRTWQIDPTLSGTLLSTAYSTARGIVYSKCQGTSLGTVLLPIISVQDLMDLADSGQNYQ